MMNGISAKSSSVILIITSFILILTIGLIAWGYWIPQQQGGLFILSSLMAVVSIGCYLRAPIGYEINSSDALIIKYRLGSRVFQKVREYHYMANPLSSFTMRLWGNGGLFAITGLFWNRLYGRFHAYITNPKKLVMVELQDGKKVVISPINAEEWNKSVG